jgi:hypothetical protein
MSQHDEKLKALLQQWRDIEPPPAFEANVWQRIRSAQLTQSERMPVIAWIWQAIRQPAFSMGVSVAVVIGAMTGFHSAPPPTTTMYAEMGFLSPGTLSGSYARLAAGESR